MFFQFLIEDQSGEKLIRALMDKIVEGNPETSYDCKFFKGIGGFKQRGSPMEIKTGKLLDDLGLYLSAFDQALQGMPAAIVIVLDNDNRDTAEFTELLEQVARRKKIEIDHVFCLAIEEMGAWLLGDAAAILAAYPKANLHYLRTYTQDSICGTWEVLANVVYPGGYNRMKQDCCVYAQIRKLKSEWAERIGKHMELQRNQSPSFRRFFWN